MKLFCIINHIQTQLIHEKGNDFISNSVFNGGV